MQKGHFIDFSCAVVLAVNGGSRPRWRTSFEQLDTVGPNSSFFWELDVVKEDKNVGPCDFIEVSQPWEKVGLVNGNDFHEAISSARNLRPAKSMYKLQ